MAEETTTAGTFTQEQVNSMVAAAVRQERQKFADYDDLKAAKEAADQQAAEQKTQLEQLTGKVTDLTDALAKRDQDALRMQVASAAKLTPQQAKFLTGKTEAELQASAQEVRETFGLKDEADEGAGDEGDQGAGTQQPQQQSSTRRPQELQAGGGTVANGAPLEMDPGKLADMIGTR
jgi:hypothetical protein